MQSIMQKSFLVTILALVYVVAQDLTQQRKAPVLVTVGIDEFRVKYGKKYGSQDEKKYRKMILENNKKKINDHNRNGKRSYDLAENQLMDYSHEEFLATFTTLLPSDPIVRQQTRDRGELQQLEENNCYCNTSNAFRKMELIQRINKNKAYVNEKLEQNARKNKKVKDNVDFQISMASKILDTPVDVTLSGQVEISAMALETPSLPDSISPVTVSDSDIITPFAAPTDLLKPNGKPSTNNGNNGNGNIKKPPTLDPLLNTEASLLGATLTATNTTTNTTTNSTKNTTTNTTTNSTKNTTTNTTKNTTTNTTAPGPMPNLTDIDWSNRTGGNVRNQGSCGACYAFAAIQAMQVGYVMFTAKLPAIIPMSVQQIIDCAYPGFNGCLGGYFEWAFYYLQYIGVTTQFAYPYKSGFNANGTNATNPTGYQCKWTKPGPFKLKSYQQQLSKNCPKTRIALQKKPVATGIVATNMQFYSSGIYDNCTSGQIINHAVLLVGYNSSYGWKFKNSWGSSWGMNGYGWVSLNQTKNCGICQQPVFAVMLDQPI